MRDDILCVDRRLDLRVVVYYLPVEFPPDRVARFRDLVDVVHKLLGLVTLVKAGGVLVNPWVHISRILAELAMTRVSASRELDTRGFLQLVQEPDHLSGEAMECLGVEKALLSTFH